MLEYSLFDSASVAIAAFLGSPVAGVALMALNYRRLQKSRNAILILAAGVAVTALAVVFGYLVPAYATTAVGISLVVATRSAAQSLQGAALDEHLRKGGNLGSRWVAAGVGMIGLVVVLSSILMGVYAQQLHSRVTYGSNDEVRYSGEATEKDARALGDALKKIGFFRDQGASVVLSKQNGATSVSFVVKDGVWQQTVMVTAFEEIAREIAPAIGGFPLKVRLVNSSQETMKEVTVGKLTVGTRDELFFFGSSTEADAQALAQSLKSMGFFMDKGIDVFLSKHEDGTTVSFVVGQGVWDQPDKVATFEDIVRHCAPSVGGLPITLRLVDPDLNLKKEVVVR